jgi:hypothetical protein
MDIPLGSVDTSGAGISSFAGGPLDGIWRRHDSISWVVESGVGGGAAGFANRCFGAAMQPVSIEISKLSDTAAIVWARGLFMILGLSSTDE